ncbi:MAG: hypothetical protein H6713_37455 [Myxococcales bacterium]|nr:hypothetical protein [Myxococcales bacterium]
MTSRPRGETAPIRVPGVRLEEYDVRLEGAPAERFGADELPGHTLNPVEQATLDAAVASTGAVAKLALSRLAHELARTAPSRFNIPTSLVDGLLAWNGIVDPPPYVSIVEIPASGGDCINAPGERTCQRAIAELIAQVQGHVTGGSWRVGAGAVRLEDGSTRILVAALEPAVTLEPVPSALPVGGRARVSGALLGGRTSPRLDIIDPSGQWRSTPLAGSGGFAGEFACDQGKGAYKVEIFAEGSHGPEVVANFPIVCGGTPASDVHVVIEHVEDGADIRAIERANFELLNRARAQRGLEALEWSDEAAAVARGHSVDMLENNYIGHRSPTTGDVAARFERAGVPAAIARENIARGYGPRGIHDSLMNSPGHRVNILAADVTHVGVGAVVGPPESNVEGAPRPIILTQNYFTAPGADLPDKPVAALQADVNADRKARGLPAVKWDKQISALAQGLADGHAAGAIDAARAKFKQQLEAVEYKRIGQSEVVAATYKQLREYEVWTQAIDADVVGVGVAKLGGEQEGSIVLVILLVYR